LTETAQREQQQRASRVDARTSRSLTLAHDAISAMIALTSGILTQIAVMSSR